MGLFREKIHAWTDVFKEMLGSFRVLQTGDLEL